MGPFEQMVESVQLVEATKLYWRGTDRKQEYVEVKNGLAIDSENYISGDLEGGMSVDYSAAYLHVYEYKYGYQVTGRSVGTGSQGEPVVKDVKVVGPLLPARQVITQEIKTDPELFFWTLRQALKSYGWGDAFNRKSVRSLPVPQPSDDIEELSAYYRIRNAIRRGDDLRRWNQWEVDLYRKVLKRLGH